jgi:predicted AlkP superfamily pyrophosphatase or phosphodiesterase
MKRPPWTSTILAVGLFALATACHAQSNRPTLVVLVSVDQLRADLVHRYSEVFSGGIKRALEEGYSFTEANHAHAVTHTAAGHATLATGVFPSRSGIVANSWAQRMGGQWVPMYAVQDAASPIVGWPDLPGRSPKNLLRGGLADWIAEADEDARIVSVSGKDRAAITMAGKAKGHVYWVDQLRGHVVTSEYYRTRYPGWVRDFNEDVMPEFTGDTVWTTSVPEDRRGLARADSADYELDGVHTVFPHWAHEERPDTAHLQNAWALSKPWMDGAVMAFAKVAIDELDLGQRDRVDYLGLAVSATDYVGHAFGPLSQEQMDNLLRLDRELGAFMDYLDEEVGEGRWVMALTADHGVLTMPEYLAEQGVAAQRVEAVVRSRAIAEVFQAAALQGGSEDEIVERLARDIEAEGLVAKAYTHHELTVGEPADSFATLYRNSYYPGRAAGWLSRQRIEVRFEFHELVSEPRGTTHGSPYWYDRHVPLIFMGPGVNPGASDGPAYSVDVAPTLARMAGIPFPDDLDGRVIYPPIF